MNAVEPEQVVIARRNVVISELPDGIALLDLDAGKYYSLNIVGAHVWRMMQAPVSEEDITSGICEHFTVARDNCRADVNKLLESLLKAGLVEASRLAPIE